LQSTETGLEPFFLKTLVSLPFVIGGIGCFLVGVSMSNHFEYNDYQGDSKRKFRDILVGNIFLAGSLMFFFVAMIAYAESGYHWSSLKWTICVLPLVLPIMIVSSFIRIYTTKQLWGGFLPTIRERYGYSQPAPAGQVKIDPAKLKLPRRIMVNAILCAILGFIAGFLLLGLLPWKWNEWGENLMRIFMSGLLAFTILMSMISAAWSRRIQRLRDGKSLEDDENG
jgi:hypothetical protein